MPKIFKNVALRGAKFAENTAKEITDREKLVDTGNYRRNWFAERIEPEEGTYGIQLENSVEYASYLEDGTGKIRGRKVGRQTIFETRYKCIQMLSDALDRAIRKHHESFTDSE